MYHDVMDTTFSISDLAQEFEVTPRTLRFYEEKGLLSPARNGQSRVYSAADRSRLRLILRGKRLGFTLGESQALIDMYQPTEDNSQQLQAILDKIEEKRVELHRQMSDLKLMLNTLDEWEQRYQSALKNTRQNHNENDS